MVRIDPASVNTQGVRIGSVLPYYSVDYSEHQMMYALTDIFQIPHSQCLHEIIIHWIT